MNEMIIPALRALSYLEVVFVAFWVTVSGFKTIREMNTPTKRR